MLMEKYALSEDDVVGLQRIFSRTDYKVNEARKAKVVFTVL